MLLILPVRTLFFCTAVGLSTYSLASWLLSLHPFELIYYTSLISTVTSLGCVAILYSLVPSFESMDAMEKRLDSLHTCSCSCSIKPYTAHRVVAEKNGTLVITTTFVDVDSDQVSDTDSDNEAEEIRERLEKEEPPASPLEETTEFADLLQKKNIE